MAKKRQNHKWTDEQILMLKDLYPKVGPLAASRAINVERGFVVTKALKLGLKYRPKRVVRVDRKPGESSLGYLRRKLTANLIDQPNGCKNWAGAKSGGYGYVVDGEQTWLTHRLAWVIKFGAIEEGKFVCHKCDNPSCCNPDHLFLGTTEDNTADRHRKGRDASGDRSGTAKLTDKQVVEIRKRYKGERGQLKTLSVEFAVSRDQIRNIVRGKQRMVGVTTIEWETGPSTKLRDLSGQTFGRLLVIRPAGKRGRNAISLCRCDCGTEKEVLNLTLLNGHCRSCGCLSRETRSALNKLNPPRLGTGGRNKNEE